MTRVVASAFRRGLAGLVVCVGFFVLPFLALGDVQMAACRSRPSLLMNECAATYVRRSSGDLPIVIGIAIASLLVAALIYPARRRVTAHTAA
jgi:hypothetical protein